LFHVPSQELPRVLLELHTTLKPGGVLFSSNPRGRNEEGWVFTGEAVHAYLGKEDFGKPCPQISLNNQY
jgi:hypothetical protein